MTNLLDIRKYLINCGFNPLSADVFLGYHKANRHLWEAYRKKCIEMIDAGAKRISSKSIFEKLREDAQLKTSAPDFKLTNTFTAYYPRVYFYPQFQHLFEFRPVGQKEAA